MKYYLSDLTFFAISKYFLLKKKETIITTNDLLRYSLPTLLGAQLPMQFLKMPADIWEEHGCLTILITC